MFNCHIYHVYQINSIKESVNCTDIIHHNPTSEESKYSKIQPQRGVKTKSYDDYEDKRRDDICLYRGFAHQLFERNQDQIMTSKKL